MSRLLPLPVLFALLLAACGGGGGGGGTPTAPVTGTYALTVYQPDGTTPLPDARVAVFNDDGQFVALDDTGADGVASVQLRAGVYTARVQAQGYEPSPAAGAVAVPFTIAGGATWAESISLTALAAPATVAIIRGNADTAGALVVASDGVQDIATSTFTDASGNYVLFNVLPGDYSVTAFKAGFESDAVLQTVAALDDVTVDLQVVSRPDLATLSGHLTFLSATNGVVDITLRHPQTLDSIPGLSTLNSGTSYSLAGVPPGNYLAWATLDNDGYVMDPDWINKNGGYPAALAVTVGSTSLVKDFSITDAVTPDSPTNTASSVVPVVVTTTTPTFNWSSYPQAKQYVVEVLDLAGNSLWGGYDFDDLTDNSTFRHALIGTSTSAQYDFDATATQPLVDGGVYLWRVYAFRDGTGADGPAVDYVAISSSEEQMGLFRVELPPPP